MQEGQVPRGLGSEPKPGWLSRPSERESVILADQSTLKKL